VIDLFARFRRQPAAVSNEQWLAAEQRLSCLRHLGATDRQRLRTLAAAFIADKQWSGAAGMELLPAAQIEIALQACLLVLNLPAPHYRDWIGIVVYPGDFVIPRAVEDENGIVHEYDDPVLGEAWEGGPVLLSWFDCPDDAGTANVVLHEFAHKLDMENDQVDGIPRLPPGLSPREWQRIFQRAYEDFCERVDAADQLGIETELDAYGSDSPAEFFAVMAEAFFETPTQLNADYPDVYGQLSSYFRQDPLAAEQSLVGNQP
jgi:MtfA peptidase